MNVLTSQAVLLISYSPWEILSKSASFLPYSAVSFWISPYHLLFATQLLEFWKSCQLHNLPRFLGHILHFPFAFLSIHLHSFALLCPLDCLYWKWWILIGVLHSGYLVLPCKICGCSCLMMAVSDLHISVLESMMIISCKIGFCILEEIMWI